MTLSRPRTSAAEIERNARMKRSETESLVRLSRRDFLEKSTQSLAAAALIGSMRKMGLAEGTVPVLRLEKDGDSVRCLAGKVSVCLFPASGIGSEGEAKTPAAFERIENSRIDRRFQLGRWEVFDEIEQVSPGLFAWHRAWKNTSGETLQADLCMEAESSYSPEFFLIPGASYNGNPKHGRTAARGLTSDGTSNGTPWIFSAFRSTVPAGTYSEGKGWSMFLFAAAQPPSLQSACSLISKSGHMVHRVLWPGRDNAPRRPGRDSTGANASAGPTAIDQCETMPIEPGASFKSVSYLVVCPAVEPRKAWSKGLDTAWQLNRHDIQEWYSPRRLWNLGIQYAHESLWYEESDFVGFSVGLTRKGDSWMQRPAVRFESGWCGQNASLGTAMLQDYLWNDNPESLRKGMRALDFWAENGRLKCGLFYTHFDVKLEALDRLPNNATLVGWAPYNPTFLGRPTEPSERYVDTCNLGYGAYFYLYASELAQRCGRTKPAWRQLGLDTCNFFADHALADGTFGKAWSLDGHCLDEDATTGAHILWPMLKAYRMTLDPRYLATARRAFRTYVDRDLEHLDCWGSAVDADAIDKESGQPLLLAALDLYEITGEKRYLRDAELAGYYLASWQWHYSAPFQVGSQMEKTKYDIFAGTSVSVRGPSLDPWGEFLALGWMRLAKATGNSLWRDRGIQSFKQATIGVSDGSLILNGLRRPVGSQNESMSLSVETPCGRAMGGNYNDWLVAWPAGLRLITLMHWNKWTDFGEEGRGSQTGSSPS